MEEENHWGSGDQEIESSEYWKNCSVVIGITKNHGRRREKRGMETYARLSAKILGEYLSRSVDDMSCGRVDDKSFRGGRRFREDRKTVSGGTMILCYELGSG